MSPEIEKFIKLLESELGYKEKGNGYTKFGKWYNSVDSKYDYSKLPWCDMFISWAAKKLGYEEWIGQFAWTPSHARWFEKQDAFGKKPEVGALVFFDWSGGKKISGIDHVGVVVEVRGEKIVTIEGNIDGGVAKRKVRDQSKVVGYGYPEKVKARLEKKRAEEELLNAVLGAQETGGHGPGAHGLYTVAGVREALEATPAPWSALSSPPIAEEELPTPEAKAGPAPTPQATAAAEQAPAHAETAARGTAETAAQATTAPQPRKGKHAKPPEPLSAVITAAENGLPARVEPTGEDRPTTEKITSVAREPFNAGQPVNVSPIDLSSPALLAPALLAAAAMLAHAKIRRLRGRLASGSAAEASPAAAVPSVATASAAEDVTEAAAEAAAASVEAATVPARETAGAGRRPGSHRATGRRRAAAPSRPGRRRRTAGKRRAGRAPQNLPMSERRPAERTRVLGEDRPRVSAEDRPSLSRSDLPRRESSPANQTRISAEDRARTFGEESARTSPKVPAQSVTEEAAEAWARAFAAGRMHAFSDGTRAPFAAVPRATAGTSPGTGGRRSERVPYRGRRRRECSVEEITTSVPDPVPRGRRHRGVSRTGWGTGPEHRTSLTAVSRGEDWFAVAEPARDRFGAGTDVFAADAPSAEAWPGSPAEGRTAADTDWFTPVGMDGLPKERSGADGESGDWFRPRTPATHRWEPEPVPPAAPSAPPLAAPVAADLPGDGAALNAPRAGRHRAPANADVWFRPGTAPREFDWFAEPTPAGRHRRS
ncbi:CHAP domain-containing protein [Thermostaphylospora chromogena]|uniref:CHAP domain-containing protein n=1 Tax=Thermostaphylospora chromogena TaxID=35622 RepID=A0A1H1FEV7_9ACTN|nr:CHAP domain-containing protein [Thermostaphylospora chromogena]SDQ99348.1 CHAP domain-containing protein [Thermostaphylospora chromogena]